MTNCLSTNNEYTKFLIDSKWFILTLTLHNFKTLNKSKPNSNKLNRLYQILIDGMNKMETYRTSLQNNKAGDDVELNRKSLQSLNSLIKVIQGKIFCISCFWKFVKVARYFNFHLFRISLLGKLTVHIHFTPS